MTKTTTNTRSRLPEKEAYAEKWGEFARTYKGRSFLKDLCKMLAESTGAAYVLIGYPENDELTHIRAAVLLAKGTLVSNYSYPLSGTPCENVVGRSCCYYPSNIQEMFPDDAELKHLAIESYIGLPVPGVEGKPLGLIALMDTKLIQNPGLIEDGLRALIPRVSKEIGKILKKKPLQKAILN